MFLVPLDMVVPTATSMVICELHRRKQSEKFLLQTLVTYPTCIKPNLRSCYYCENFIPQTYLLIHTKHEFNRLIQSIEQSPHEAIIRRDSEFLKYLLLLINEAVAVYGSTYVQTFIDLKEIRTVVLRLKDKLMLTSKE